MVPIRIMYMSCQQLISCRQSLMTTPLKLPSTFQMAPFIVGLYTYMEHVVDAPIYGSSDGTKGGRIAFSSTDGMQ